MNIITLLEWDTNFFGFPVAQIWSHRLDQNKLDEAFSFCSRHQVRLLQFKCDAHHRSSVLLAEKNHFHFADVRITLCKKLTDLDSRCPTLPDGVSFRKAEFVDIPALHNIVTDLYTNSRYYFDTNFPRDDVQGFYRVWIERSVKGKFDDFVWVLCFDDNPIGCCSVNYNSDQSSTIGLFGIDPNMSGQGFGVKLIQEVLYSMFNRGVENVAIVTQGRNYGAQRLYQRAGFHTEKMEIYYHRWFGQEGEDML